MGFGGCSIAIAASVSCRFSVGPDRALLPFPQRTDLLPIGRLVLRLGIMVDGRTPAKRSLSELPSSIGFALEGGFGQAHSLQSKAHVGLWELYRDDYRRFRRANFDLAEESARR